jgi:hypothetical protein
MQTLQRSFVAMLLLALALAPVACASTPPAPVREAGPVPGASGPPAEGGALPACPAGAVDGGACTEQGMHCSVAEGPGPLQCAASGQWVVTPPCCKK